MDAQEWWSAKDAARRVNLDPETIRIWGRSGKVAMRAVSKKRHRQEFLASDVRKAAGYLETEALPGGLDEGAALRDRNTVLEEVLRRYRLIDEQRDEIDRWHREIEELLQGTAPVPNN